MQLSKKTISQITGAAGQNEALFSLPEKVLQFGTGVLLRGLPDHFINKANRMQLFNGRIVVVKSTNTGGTDAFKQQDGLFTLLERGVENGQRVERSSINAAISRVLSATDEWAEILTCAGSGAMQVIISNTTEVGITLLESDATAERPVSFPGRLLAFLEHRYQVFKGSIDAGMVIVPTELIVDNGTQLKTIVTKLAQLKGCDELFLQWLDTANDFCNSLVDRIVPGKLSPAELRMAQQELGYEDELMIMSETYSLWAIETNSERTRNILSFSQADKTVILAADINKFRELKLRLLNGTHTFSCGLAFLAGFATVKDAMNDPDIAGYVSALMLQEIVPLVAQGPISLPEANTFSVQVIDRFKNPYIEHQWLSISVQYSSKMLMRTVPLLEKHYTTSDEVPELMALGFAAYLLFSRPVEKTGNTYYGEYNGQRYPVQDDKAALLYQAWHTEAGNGLAVSVLSQPAIFGSDLTRFNGFAEAVQLYLASLIQQGVINTLHSGILKKTVA